MRAAVLDRPAPVESHPLALRDVPRPRPGPGQVLVQVTVCGICRTDLHVVEGDLELRRSPIVPGHQIVGTIVERGPDVTSPALGRRVGVAWLHRACGRCAYCASGRENLCDDPDFTGWTVDGGYAEYALAAADFCYPLPDDVDDLQTAPLLCAGIIGFRSLELTGLQAPGRRLGLYGFGAAGHVVIQLARARGFDVYVATRDAEHHQSLARELGATWVGGAAEAPPDPLDASIIFAPAGELVPPALQALGKGGVLVLGGIHMSPMPPLEYGWLYGERVIRTVTNNTREDGHRFLEEAARAGITTHVTPFPLGQANEALAALKNDAFRGAGALVVSDA